MLVRRMILVSLIVCIAAYLSSCGKQMTEEEMYTAAQESYGNGDFIGSVEMYEKLLQEFPESVNQPKSLFMIGFIYANHLQDSENAKTYYTELIERFPDHEFVDDAEFELENLGKDPLELDKVLQERIIKSNKDQK
ncbi:tetratricopeptide repeat protein [candidate division KSB1 bacterium]